MEEIFSLNGEFKIYHFKKRLNRFVVETEENDLCHLHDPGRLSELLVSGAELRAILKNNGLKCEIISVKNGEENVFINSKFHSKIAENLINKKLLNSNFKIIKREIAYENSRLDFLLEWNKINYFLEVKGCTLVKNGIAKFPDAPTTRGAKHLRDLIKIKNSGFGSGILFLIFRDAKYFSPNYETDKNFYFEMINAIRNGVDLFLIKLYFDGTRIYFNGKAELKFDGPAGI